MNSPSNGFKNESDELANQSSSSLDPISPEPQKGPISFLSGSITSLSFSFLSLFISKKIVIYFSIHSPNYSSPFAQSIASGFKTLIIGISFLATFTFGFIGLGLFLVFIRSLIEGNKDKTDQHLTIKLSYLDLSMTLHDLGLLVLLLSPGMLLSILLLSTFAAGG